MVGHEYKTTIFTHVSLFVNGYYILWTCIYNTAFLFFIEKINTAVVVFCWTTWEYIKISLIWWQKSCEKCVCRMFGILFYGMAICRLVHRKHISKPVSFFFSIITIGVAKQTEHMIVPRVLPKLFPDKATYKKFKGNMYSLSCTIFYFLFFLRCSVSSL